MILQKAIYQIKNLVNNKIYIGQTVRPDKRWLEHKQRARRHLDDYPIHLAISKYGEDNFVFSILEWTYNYDEREKELIIKYNSLCPNGYNVSSGGSNYVMCGEDHPRSTVTDVDVEHIIYELQENKLSDRQIAKKYNTSDKVIADINHGYSHRIDNYEYPIRNKKGLQKLTIDQVTKIKALLKNSPLSYDNIACMFNVSKGAIYHINKGLTFIDKNIEYPIRRKNDS